MIKSMDFLKNNKKKIIFSLIIIPTLIAAIILYIKGFLRATAILLLSCSLLLLTITLLFSIYSLIKDHKSNNLSRDVERDCNIMHSAARFLDKIINSKVIFIVLTISVGIFLFFRPDIYLFILGPILLFLAIMCISNIVLNKMVNHNRQEVDSRLDVYNKAVRCDDNVSGIVTSFKLIIKQAGVDGSQIRSINQLKDVFNVIKEMLLIDNSLIVREIGVNRSLCKQYIIFLCGCFNNIGIHVKRTADGIMVTLDEQNIDFLSNVNLILDVLKLSSVFINECNDIYITIISAIRDKKNSTNYNRGVDIPSVQTDISGPLLHSRYREI